MALYRRKIAQISKFFVRCGLGLMNMAPSRKT
jgi:hypothetical protein